jgi:alpha-glucosidase
MQPPSDNNKALPGKPEWWRGAVIYQIYPRSFYDSNHDGVGDLAGITARLSHIAGLGCDGIWLSPFFLSPMKDFGYDVSDYRQVDPVFGSMEDFDRLIAHAHELGLRVIIDQVYSHTSDRHPWFAESRRDRYNAKADWYVWADPRPDGTAPNNWLGVFGGTAWQWEPRRRQYYLHNFLIEQPDLNLANPAVQDAIIEVARFWLDRGVDGFRLDVANLYTHDRLLRDNPPAMPGASGSLRTVKPYDMQRHLYDRSRPENLAFIRRLRQLLDTYPDRMAVAELFTDNPARRMAEYTADADLLHTAYSFVFLGEAFGAEFIRNAVTGLLTESGEAWPCWAFSNHDRVRVATRWGFGRPLPAWTKLLLVLLTSLRGTAFVYQGEELGLPESNVPFEKLQDPDGKAFWPEYKGRDGCRTPMPWSADAPLPSTNRSKITTRCCILPAAGCAGAGSIPPCERERSAFLTCRSRCWASSARTRLRRSCSCSIWDRPRKRSPARNWQRWSRGSISAGGA